MKPSKTARSNIGGIKTRDKAAKPNGPPKLLALPPANKVPLELRVLLSDAEKGDWNARFAFALELENGTESFRNPKLAIQMLQEIASGCKNRRMIRNFIPVLSGSPDKDRVVMELAKVWLEQFDLALVDDRNFALAVMSRFKGTAQFNSFCLLLAQTLLKFFNPSYKEDQGFAREFLAALPQSPEKLKVASDLAESLLKQFNPAHEHHQGLAAILLQELAGAPQLARLAAEFARSALKVFRVSEESQKVFVGKLLTILRGAENEALLVDLCKRWGEQVRDAESKTEMIRTWIEVGHETILFEFVAAVSPQRRAGWIEAAHSAGSTELVITLLFRLSTTCPAARCLRVGLTYLEAGRSIETRKHLTQSGLMDALAIGQARCLLRSWRNSFDLHAFHSVCDGVGPTLVIIETDRDDVFGGYTPIPWASEGDQMADPSCGSFLFILQSSKVTSPVILNMTNSEGAVYHGSNVGPCFGDTLGLGSDFGWVGPLGSYSGVPDSSYFCSDDSFRFRCVEVWFVSPVASRAEE